MQTGNYKARAGNTAQKQAPLTTNLPFICKIKKKNRKVITYFILINIFLQTDHNKKKNN